MSDMLECVLSYPLLHFHTVGQGVSAAVVDGDIAGWKTERKHYFIRQTFSLPPSTETAASAPERRYATSGLFHFQKPLHGQQTTEPGYGEFLSRRNCTGRLILRPENKEKIEINSGCTLPIFCLSISLSLAWSLSMGALKPGLLFLLDSVSPFWMFLS